MQILYSPFNDSELALHMKLWLCDFSNRRSNNKQLLQINIPTVMAFLVISTFSCMFPAELCYISLFELQPIKTKVIQKQTCKYCTVSQIKDLA